MLSAERDRFKVKYGCQTFAITSDNHGQPNFNMNTPGHCDQFLPELRTFGLSKCPREVRRMSRRTQNPAKIRRRAEKESGTSGTSAEEDSIVHKENCSRARETLTGHRMNKAESQEDEGNHLRTPPGCTRHRPPRQREWTTCGIRHELTDLAATNVGRWKVATWNERAGIAGPSLIGFPPQSRLGWQGGTGNRLLEKCKVQCRVLHSGCTRSVHERLRRIARLRFG